MRLNKWEVLGCVLVGAFHWLIAHHEAIEVRNPTLIAANIAGDVLAVFILYFLGKLIWIGIGRITRKSPKEPPV